jgi:hypothetical protein
MSVPVPVLTLAILTIIPGTGNWRSLSVDAHFGPVPVEKKTCLKFIPDNVKRNRAYRYCSGQTMNNVIPVNSTTVSEAGVGTWQKPKAQLTWNKVS